MSHAVVSPDSISWTERRPMGAMDVDQDWRTAASSADGSRLIAGVFDGRLYISSDGGAHFTETQPAGAINKSWYAVASNADGMRLIAGVYSGRLYTSSNGGASWTERQPAGPVDKIWRALASSADGLRLIAGAYNGRLYTSSDGGASWTERQPAGAADKLWRAVASSSDGLRLIAGSQGRLYTSVDGGVSWTERQPAGAIDKTWSVVASDADGSHLIAGAYNGRLYTSSNGGVSWTLRTLPTGETNSGWTGSAISADGMRMIVGFSLGICTSADGGITWTARQPAGTAAGWLAVASDGTGTRLIAGNARLYTSADGGTMWTERRPMGTMDVDQDWRTAASSADGTRLIAGVFDGRIYISSDGGAQFTETQPAGPVNKYWYAVASNSDGMRLIAGVYSGRLYTSSNGGASWTERQPAGAADKIWRALASSADGLRLIAGAYNGRLYTSVDGGATWTERQPAGAADKLWRAVASSADGLRLIAGSQGRLYTSSDGGVTWTERQPAGAIDKTWGVVASDASGSHLIAGVYNGRLYTSSNGGASWTLRTLPTGETNSAWNGAAISADGTRMIVGFSIGLCTSADGGATWTARQPAGTPAGWLAVASDGTGTRLVAGNARLYTGAVASAPDSFTLTPSAGPNGSISPNTVQTVNAGASKTFVMTPAPNYRVANVLVDGVSAGAITSYTFTNVTADHTIAVSFEPVELPIITQNPKDQTVNEGASVAFSVAATGPGLSYQWRKNGTPISNATTATYSIAAAAASDAAAYDCVVTSIEPGRPSYSVTSAKATLVVITRPVITAQPENQFVNEGETALFGIIATGPGPLSYRWKKNGVEIPLATNDTYSTPATTLADSGTRFTCVVTNAAGSAESAEAVLTVNAGHAPVIAFSGSQITEGTATLLEGQLLAFSIQAADTDAGQSVSISASGLPTGAVLNGPASSKTFEWTPTFAQAGSYNITFRATDDGQPPSTGSKLLRIVVGNVNRAPVPGVAGVDKNAAVGETVTLDADEFMFSDPDDDGIATFRWSQTAGPAVMIRESGSAMPQFVVPGTTENTVFTFRLVVTDDGAPEGVSSVPVFVFVHVAPAMAPSIITQPGEPAVSKRPGESFSIVVGATGSPPPSYQWRKNGVAITGAVSNTFTISDLAATDSGMYDCLISNIAGSIVSDRVVLTVGPPSQSAPLRSGFEPFINKFNPSGGESVAIFYAVAPADHVSLVIYDRTGQTVRDLINDDRAEGSYSVDWDGKNGSGSAVSSGSYLAVLKIGGTVYKRKIILVK